MSNYTSRTPSQSNLYEQSSEVLSSGVLAVQLTSVFSVYYIPLLVVFGSLGNLTAIYVFHKSKLRLQSTSQYLTALALSDCVFLWQLLPPWLNAVHVTTIFHYSGFCQAFVYISYVTCGLSAWLVVAFTTERYVAVVYPLRRNSLCTVKRARHVIVALATGAFLVNAPVIRYAMGSTNDCNINTDYAEHAARFNIVDTTLTFTMPLTLIVLLNICIVIGVSRLERARHHLVRTQRTSGSSQPPNGTGGVRAQHHITRMLLLVSTMYVVFNLPAYTIRLLAYANNNNTGEMTNWWAALQQLATLFFNTNFGINFFLYCLSGQNFRNALYLSVPWMRNKESRSNAVRLTNNRTGRTSISTSIVSTAGTDATSNFPSVGTSGVRNEWSSTQDPAFLRWNTDRLCDANNNSLVLTDVDPNYNQYI